MVRSFSERSTWTQRTENRRTLWATHASFALRTSTRSRSRPRSIGASVNFMGIRSDVRWTSNL